MADWFFDYEDGTAGGSVPGSQEKGPFFDPALEEDGVE